MRNVVTSETLLWSRSLLGDGEAFGALFDEHRDRVFRHAYRLVMDRRDAEDVTATAFLELWRRRSSVRMVNESVLPWLLVTATKAARNVRRSGARYRKLLAALPRTPSTSASEGAFFAAHPSERIDPRLATALRSLPVTDLHLISLVALEGFTVAEAATALGLSTAAAKARLHRARGRLRTLLGDVVNGASWSADEGGPG